MRLEIRPSPDGVADLAAEMIADELAVPGPCTLGLSGGTTPRPTYARLADARIGWEDVVLWLGDERWVPPEDPGNNGSCAAALLGEQAATSLVRPEFPDGGPQQAAAGYGRSLREVFAPHGGRPHTVLLGVGTDGHTASLFPGTAATRNPANDYVATRAPHEERWRLTATIALLSSARHVVFLVTGRGKARIVRKIIDEASDHPAALVARSAGDVTWILDEGAASGLSLRNRRR